MAAPTTSIAVAPIVVTDRTCAAVLGVSWRTLRGWCAEREIPVGHIGRRPCVRIDRVLAALDGSAEQPPAGAWSVDSLVSADRKGGAR
jgi:hypothetical protein